MDLGTQVMCRMRSLMFSKSIPSELGADGATCVEFECTMLWSVLTNLVHYVSYLVIS